MDHELTTYLDARFRELAQQIAADRMETFQQTANLREVTTQGLGRVASQVEKVEETMRRDRVHHLDVRIDALERRVQILENRAERQQGDVYDALRKMLGKAPLSISSPLSRESNPG